MLKCDSFVLLVAHKLPFVNPELDRTKVIPYNGKYEKRGGDKKEVRGQRLQEVGGKGRLARFKSLVKGQNPEVSGHPAERLSPYHKDRFSKGLAVAFGRQTFLLSKIPS